MWTLTAFGDACKFPMRCAARLCCLVLLFTKVWRCLQLGPEVTPFHALLGCTTCWELQELEARLQAVRTEEQQAATAVAEAQQRVERLRAQQDLLAEQQREHQQEEQHRRQQQQQLRAWPAAHSHSHASGVYVYWAIVVLRHC